MKKVRVYIACALTYADQAYKDEIELFKKQLRKNEWIEVLDFVGKKTEGDTDEAHATRVYEHDIHGCVATAHAIVAELSLPSTGLGWELGTSAEKHKIRIIMFARQGVAVSGIPWGASFFKENKHVSFERYAGSIVEQVSNVVRELRLVHQAIN